MFYGSDTQDFGIYSWVILTPVLVPRGCLFCWQSTADNKNSLLTKGKIFSDFSATTAIPGSGIVIELELSGDVSNLIIFYQNLV